MLAEIVTLAAPREADGSGAMMDGGGVFTPLVAGPVLLKKTHHNHYLVSPKRILLKMLSLSLLPLSHYYCSHHQAHYRRGGSM